MGRVLDEIGSGEAAFISKQKVFFVATAPLSRKHHVNVSPKAPGSSVVVLSPHKVAYVDLTGSGAETAAHVMENGRMTMMFCNLEEGPPKILRLHGKAEMIVKERADQGLLSRFPAFMCESPGFRSVFVLSVERISSSCGFSLPIMKYEKTRSTLDEYTDRKGVEGMKDYCVLKNSFSIDGLPSVALLRNPELTIAPVEQEGYIQGQVVTDRESRIFPGYPEQFRKETLTTLSIKLLSVETVVAFAIGVLLGVIVCPILLPSFPSIKTLAPGLDL